MGATRGGQNFEKNADTARYARYSREYRALKIFWITQKFVRKISKNSIETHKTQNFGSEFGGGR